MPSLRPGPRPRHRSQTPPGVLVTGIAPTDHRQPQARRAVPRSPTCRFLDPTSTAKPAGPDPGRTAVPSALPPGSGAGGQATPASLEPPGARSDSIRPERADQIAHRTPRAQAPRARCGSLTCQFLEFQYRPPADEGRRETGWAGSVPRGRVIRAAVRKRCWRTRRILEPPGADEIQPSRMHDWITSRRPGVHESGAHVAARRPADLSNSGSGARRRRPPRSRLDWIRAARPGRVAALPHGSPERAGQIAYRGRELTRRVLPDSTSSGTWSSAGTCACGCGYWQPICALVRRWQRTGCGGDPSRPVVRPLAPVPTTATCAEAISVARSRRRPIGFAIAGTTPRSAAQPPRRTCQVSTPVLSSVRDSMDQWPDRCPWSLTGTASGRAATAAMIRLVRSVQAFAAAWSGLGVVGFRVGEAWLPAFDYGS